MKDSADALRLTVDQIASPGPHLNCTKLLPMVKNRGIWNSYYTLTEGQWKKQLDEILPVCIILGKITGVKYGISKCIGPQDWDILAAIDAVRKGS